MGEERRQDPRFSYTMKAYLEDGRSFVTTDVSAGGAYFAGDPGVPVGSSLFLRLELATTDALGRPTLFPLDAEVMVARVSLASDGTVQGFGARWIEVSCVGDLKPLRQLLKAILSVPAGFVELLQPVPDGAPRFRFVFPGPDVPREEGEKAPQSQVEPRETRTGVYVMLPVTVEMDGEEFSGNVVKMLAHAMRISSNNAFPEPYRRVTVKIAVKRRDKTSTLELVGTVSAVRLGQGDNQFEVELSLGNDPEALLQYRKMLENIVATLRK